MRYRIALCGFSEFEYRAMHFSFLHPSGFHEAEYDVVDALDDADFAVVDADSKPAVKNVLQAGRLGRTVFVGGSAPPGAARHLPRPIDTTRILRALDELTASQTVPAAFRDLPVEREFPTLDDAIDLTPLERSAPPEMVIDLPLEPLEPPQAPPAPFPEEDLWDDLPARALADPVADFLADPPPPSAAPVAPVDAAAARRALQSLAKAAARAAARRARLASAQASGGALEPLRDVLVLDADRVANTLLCSLLERFGFQPHAVHTTDKAETALALRPFAAVFLDIALDETGVALLNRIRALPARTPYPAPAVVMVTAHMDPADRVRAALAGVTAPLMKPLGRGDVARTLEASGVVLPADARRL